MVVRRRSPVPVFAPVAGEFAAHFSFVSQIHLFTWAADIWWADSEVIVPLLKFTAEFVHNRSQRISFDQSSANGILLFKEVSSILLTYGKRSVHRPGFLGHVVPYERLVVYYLGFPSFSINFLVASTDRSSSSAKSVQRADSFGSRSTGVVRGRSLGAARCRSQLRVVQ